MDFWPAAWPENKVEALMTCSKQDPDFGLVFEGLIWKTYMVKWRSIQFSHLRKRTICISPAKIRICGARESSLILTWHLDD